MSFEGCFVFDGNLIFKSLVDVLWRWRKNDCPLFFSAYFALMDLLRSWMVIALLLLTYLHLFGTTKAGSYGYSSSPLRRDSPHREKSEHSRSSGFYNFGSSEYERNISHRLKSRSSRGYTPHRFALTPRARGNSRHFNARTSRIFDTYKSDSSQRVRDVTRVSKPKLFHRSSTKKYIFPPLSHGDNRRSKRIFSLNSNNYNSRSSSFTRTVTGSTKSRFSLASGSKINYFPPYAHSFARRSKPESSLRSTRNKYGSSPAHGVRSRSKSEFNLNSTFYKFGFPPLVQGSAQRPKSGHSLSSNHRQLQSSSIAHAISRGLKSSSSYYKLNSSSPAAMNSRADHRSKSGFSSSSSNHRSYSSSPSRGSVHHHKSEYSGRYGSNEFGHSIVAPESPRHSKAGSRRNSGSYFSRSSSYARASPNRSVSGFRRTLQPYKYGFSLPFHGTARRYKSGPTRSLNSYPSDSPRTRGAARREKSEFSRDPPYHKFGTTREEDGTTRRPKTKFGSSCVSSFYNYGCSPESPRARGAARREKSEKTRKFKSFQPPSSRTKAIFGKPLLFDAFESPGSKVFPKVPIGKKFFEWFKEEAMKLCLTVDFLWLLYEAESHVVLLCKIYRWKSAVVSAEALWYYSLIGDKGGIPVPGTEIFFEKLYRCWCERGSTKLLGRIILSRIVFLKSSIERRL